MSVSVHSWVVPEHSTQTPSTQYGVSAGQGTVSLSDSAPSTHAFWAVSLAHSYWVASKPCPSGVQV